MREVLVIVKSMGPEQMLLALVFLASYALALGRFASSRGRTIAVTFAVGSGAAFAACSSPWEAGIVAVGFASVGMGAFSAAVWALWAATASRAARLPAPAPTPALAPEPAPGQEPEANLPRTRAVSSPRSVNTAPILNSPGAE